MAFVLCYHRVPLPQVCPMHWQNGEASLGRVWRGTRLLAATTDRRGILGEGKQITYLPI